jgi:hypothetical protein
MTQKTGKNSFADKVLKKSKSLGHPKLNLASINDGHKTNEDIEEKDIQRLRSKSPTRKSRFFQDTLSSIKYEESSIETRTRQRKRDLLKLISQLSKISRESLPLPSNTITHSGKRKRGGPLFERGYDKMRNFVRFFPHNNFEVVLVKLAIWKKKKLEKLNPFKFLLPVNWALASPTNKPSRLKKRISSIKDEKNDSVSRKSGLLKFIESSFTSLFSKFHSKKL